MNQPDPVRVAERTIRIPRRSIAGRSARFLVALLVLGSLLVVAWLGARPAYASLKRVRALSRVQGLDDPESVVPMKEAVTRLRLALLAAPGDPDVLRVAARFSSRMRLREAVDHWARYLSTTQPTDAERIEAAGVAIEGGRPDLGRQWLGELLGRTPDDPRIPGPLFQLALRVGTSAGAETLARRRVQVAPGDVDARLDLGRLLLQSPDPKAREEALKVLTALGCDAKADVEARQRALGLLLSTMPLEHPESARVLEAARSMAESSLEARLLSWDLEAKADPTRGVVLLREAADVGRRETTSPGRPKIALWLASRGGVKDALDLVPLDSCTNSFDTASVRLDCLLGLGRTSELMETLDRCAPVLPAGCRESMLGSLAIRRGETNAAEAHFQTAIQKATAGGEQRTFDYVTREGLRFGLLLVALDALEAGLPLSREPMLVIRRMVAVLQGVPDLSRVLQALRIASRVLPEEPSVTIERAWHELYLGHSTAWCVAELDKLVRAGSPSRDVGMAYAFALARSGDLAGAQRQLDLEVARGEDPGWLPRHQMVRVQIMGASGQREGARTLARSLRLEGVRSEVRPLVEPWL